MFTKPEVLMTRARTRARQLLVSLSHTPSASPAEGTVGNAAADARPARTRPAAARLVAAAAALMVPAFLLAVAGPAAAVSLSGTTGLPVIAVEGPGNSLEYYYQSPPGTWHEQQVAAPGWTFSAPSLAQAGTTTVIAAEGPANSLIFYIQHVPGGSWIAKRVAGPGTTFSAPSVAVVNSGSSWSIAAEGPGNSLMFYYQYFTLWAGQQVAGSGTTFSAPSLAEIYLGLGIAAEGSSNSLDFYAQGTSGAWTAQQAAADGTTFSAPSLAMLNTGTGIAADGPSGSLMLYTHTNPAGTWQSQQVASAGAAHSAPSLTQLAELQRIGTFYYTMIAVGGHLGLLDVYTKGPALISPWQDSVPGGLNSTLSAPSLAPVGGAGVATEGAIHSLNYYSQPAPYATWTHQQVPGTGAYG